ncbi:MAG: ribonuclease HII [bacterium]|nr:ribonuclease HII [bacterium]
MVNFNEEKKLWKQGYECVVGLDEAGRGPLAGPVVAGAVMVKGKSIKLKGLDDSKKISEKQREYFYGILTNHSHIIWGVGIVSEKEIDKINILEASKLAMKKALRQAQGKAVKSLNADFLLIDGNFGLQEKIPERSIIKGDSKVFSIAAASIIAKVTRDRLMHNMHKKYPQYGFDLHKGYGTALHIANLKNFGPSKIHRKTFFPVRALNHEMLLRDFL